MTGLAAVLRPRSWREGMAHIPPRSVVKLLLLALVAIGLVPWHKRGMRSDRGPLEDGGRIGFALRRHAGAAAQAAQSRHRLLRALRRHSRHCRSHLCRDAIRQDPSSGINPGKARRCLPRAGSTPSANCLRPTARNDQTHSRSYTMKMISIMGAALALAVPATAFAAGCCADAPCCKEGTDPCKDGKSCCDETRNDEHAGHGVPGAREE